MFIKQLLSYQKQKPDYYKNRVKIQNQLISDWRSVKKNFD